jgi:hypothetical protein
LAGFSGDTPPYTLSGWRTISILSMGYEELLDILSGAVALHYLAVRRDSLGRLLLS